MEHLEKTNKHMTETKNSKDAGNYQLLYKYYYRAKMGHSIITGRTRKDA